MRGLVRFEQERSTFFIYEVLFYGYLLTVVAWCVVLLLVNVPHTYFWNLSRPGTLFSMRYRSLGSILLILSALRVFFPVSVRTLFRFKRNRECSWAWLVLALMLCLLDIFTFLWVLSQVGSANKTGSFYNFLCNDAAYCCVFYSDPNCQNDRMCTDPVFTQSDLTLPGLCVVAFIVSLLSMAIAVAMTLWPFFTRDSAIREDDDVAEDIFIESKPPQSQRWVSAQQSNVRKRFTVKGIPSLK